LGNVFVGSPSARARQPILSANWNFLSFKVKFEPIFFQVFWQFFNLKGSLLRQRRTGVAGGRGVGGNSARHTNFGRNQFEFFLAKIRIPNFKIQSFGWAKRKEVGVPSPPGIFARPRFLIPIFFRRHRISYFALQNAPLIRKLCLPRPPVRTQQKLPC